MKFIDFVNTYACGKILSFISQKGVKGSFLSLFRADDIPVFGRVILRINCQVNDIESGIQSLQVIQVNLFEPLFIVKVGLLGEGIRFVVLFATF